LTDKITDAYYYIDTAHSQNGKPFINLSTHSLDSYPHCQASSQNPIADIGTFTPGYSNPFGDYQQMYPKANKIDGLYYYVSGEQFPCTAYDSKTQAASDLDAAVRQAFIDAYSTIEPIPH